MPCYAMDAKTSILIDVTDLLQEYRKFKNSATNAPSTTNTGSNRKAGVKTLFCVCNFGSCAAVRTTTTLRCSSSTPSMANYYLFTTDIVEMEKSQKSFITLAIIWLSIISIAERATVDFRILASVLNTSIRLTELVYSMHLSYANTTMNIGLGRQNC
uniref:Uncharacterized protein n=1 Tax=Glossina austeni TaxID=7395 RepID=A0A1A9V8S6_GLOAU